MGGLVSGPFCEAPTPLLPAPSTMEPTDGELVEPIADDESLTPDGDTDGDEVASKETAGPTPDHEPVAPRSRHLNRRSRHLRLRCQQGRGPR